MSDSKYITEWIKQQAEKRNKKKLLLDLSDGSIASALTAILCKNTRLTTYGVVTEIAGKTELDFGIMVCRELKPYFELRSQYIDSDMRNKKSELNLAKDFAYIYFNA